MTDEEWMRPAPAMAEQGDLAPGTNAIGCVIVRKAFRDDVTYAGGVPAAECSALYVSPDEKVSASDQANR